MATSVPKCMQIKTLYQIYTVKWRHQSIAYLHPFHFNMKNFTLFMLLEQPVVFNTLMMM